MTDTRREWLTLATALLLAGVFFFCFHLVMAGRAEGADDAALAALKGVRSPALTHFFLELTALGSVTVLTLLVLFALALMLTERKRRAAAQLALAAISSALLTQLLKHFAARPRPPLADRLDLATGFSFPSGHSSSGAAIYLTLALLLFPVFARRASQAAFLAGAALLIGLLGSSRAYLAVHYPSDVLGGLCLGTGIALLTHLALNPRSAWHLRRK